MARELRGREGDGLLERRELTFAKVRHVECRPTSMAEPLAPAIPALADWGRRHGRLL
ncbi:MAG: hypothetical protein KDC98_26805 [Planctomycetes bacterium]|nr:hypothetical protein [Planctomycetota bacterium]